MVSREEGHITVGWLMALIEFPQNRLQVPPRHRRAVEQMWKQIGGTSEVLAIHIPSKVERKDGGPEPGTIAGFLWLGDYEVPNRQSDWSIPIARSHRLSAGPKLKSLLLDFRNGYRLWRQFYPLMQGAAPVEIGVGQFSVLAEALAYFYESPREVSLLAPAPAIAVETAVQRIISAFQNCGLNRLVGEIAAAEPRSTSSNELTLYWLTAIEEWICASVAFSDADHVLAGIGTGTGKGSLRFDGRGFDSTMQSIERLQALLPKALETVRQIRDQLKSAEHG